MLQLKDITKTYKSNGIEVHALKGINLSFNNNEFVSILGPSGCGKTTLLNIIGGLDKYTTGDLLIEGKSTKDYKEEDWNTYRNHSIGFVFQSYNLIPHQTIIQNVEISLTIAGVSKKERRERALAALEKVGLADQANKKPNQLSGGQMQRVAIARAIVNSPEIILADEPTGALDSETGLMVMDILKELSKNTLVIMVTHNPDLAYQYSTRIIKLNDGLITDDSVNSVNEETTEIKDKPKTTKKKSSMNFFTAFILSLNNLISKRGRTILVSIAGSIGIIGIGLVLAIATGFQDYIDKVQMDTLSSYPLIVNENSIDISSILSYRQTDLEKYPLVEKIYINELSKLASNLIVENNIDDSYLTDVIDNINPKLYSDIRYSYDCTLHLYTKTARVTDLGVEDCGYRAISRLSSLGETWAQLLNKDLVMSQYDLIYGSYPDSFDDLVIVVDEYNRISDVVIASLGLQPYIETEEDGTQTIDFDKVLTHDYRFLNNNLIYSPVVQGGKVKYYQSNVSQNMVSIDLFNQGTPLRISGIMRLKESSTMGSMGQLSAIGYLPELIDYMFEVNEESDIVKFQIANPTIDCRKGVNFSSTASNTTYEKQMKAIMGSKIPNNIEIFPVDFEAKNKIKEYLDNVNDLKASEIARGEYIELGKTRAVELGMEPDEDLGEESLNEYYYNIGYNYSTNEEKNEIKIKSQKTVVQYTDVMNLIIDSVSSIVDGVSYVLIAFTSISLVVSSIMIAVITYISVIERTKEIGILRAVGAKRSDVSHIFNAETFIIGLFSGVIGITVTLLLCIPINVILTNLASLGNIAGLRVIQVIVLILIAIILNVIAGIIPSQYAAKLDPVAALRSE